MCVRLLENGTDKAVMIITDLRFSNGTNFHQSSVSHVCVHTMGEKNDKTTDSLGVCWFDSLKDVLDINRLLLDTTETRAS